MCDRSRPTPISTTGMIRLTLFETAGCATACDRAAALHRRPAASRSSKPRDVRPHDREDAHLFAVPPHALRNRGMCDGRIAKRKKDGAVNPPHALRNRGMCDSRRISRRRFRFPPHALRNRGMCDKEEPAVWGEAIPPPHALRNRGMCDETIEHDALPPHYPPHALRNRGMCDGESVARRVDDLHAASRSSKPRDVRQRKRFAKQRG